MPARSKFDKALAAYQAKNFIKARKLCNQVIEIQPFNYDALHLGGLLAVNRGDKVEAIDLIEKSLAIQPSQPSAHNNIGNVFRKLDRYDEALAAYREATRQKPDFADAWASMALVYYEQGENSKAEGRATKALTLQADHVGASHTMGLIHLDNGDMDAAAAAFVKCSKFESPEGFSPIWYAQFLTHFGRNKEAQQLLEEILERDPDDVAAQFYYDAIFGTKLEKVSDDAVRKIFDGFAANFDKTLKNLNYRAPEFVADQVVKLYSADENLLKIADLGCGTGLVGSLISPVSKHLVGVDLSPNMLAQSKKLQIYDQLVEAELTAFLKDGPSGQFDLITCADTLIYLGDLTGVMNAVAHALSQGGHFVATVETGDPLIESEKGYLLHSAGRFAHSKKYLRKVLADNGLSLLELSHETLRKQGGKPVEGMVFTAQLPKFSR